jgi:hypothetical protein
MRAKEFLKLIQEATAAKQPVPGDPKSDPLYHLKLVIANKIKDLPPTPETKNSLEEIEDVLSHIQVSRRQSATMDLGAWSDEDVIKAKDMLAKYIVSLEAPISYKKSMLDHWKNGGLINVDVMLDGTHTINEVVKDYDSNPAIKELTNDLMQVAGVGKGKGEFMLKVLSPQITDPGKSGDILIKGFGTVEVKTTDGGAGRFYDRQVKPAPGYSAAVQAFKKEFSNFLSEDADVDPMGTPVEQPQPTTPATAPVAKALAKPAKAIPAKAPKKSGISKSGISIDGLISIYNQLDAMKKKRFLKLLSNALGEVLVEASEFIHPVVQAIASGNSGKAKQLYGVGIMINYMNHKNNAGILYIDLTSKIPQFTYFTDNASLNAGGLRLHVDTCYLITNEFQYLYPQTRIVPTGKDQPGI